MADDIAELHALANFIANNSEDSTLSQPPPSQQAPPRAPNCGICFHQPLEVRLLPCGHLCCKCCRDQLRSVSPYAGKAALVVSCPFCVGSISSCENLEGGSKEYLEISDNGQIFWVPVVDKSKLSPSAAPFRPVEGGKTPSDVQTPVKANPPKKPPISSVPSESHQTIPSKHDVGPGRDHLKACHRCGIVGHMARDCPENPPKNEKRCYNCNELGHISRFCPNNRDSSGHESRNIASEEPANHLRACLTCGTIGHIASNCPLKESPELALEQDFPAGSRFFILRSFSEHDIQTSIDREIWTSSVHVNRRLDAAFKDAESQGIGVYFFYSANGSGKFCGVAQMKSSVDFDKMSRCWAEKDWPGEFKIKWLIVKDVPNRAFSHIKIHADPRRVFAHSRDGYSVDYRKGVEAVKVFMQYESETTLLDDERRSIPRPVFQAQTPAGQGKMHLHPLDEQDDEVDDEPLRRVCADYDEIPPNSPWSQSSVGVSDSDPSETQRANFERPGWSDDDIGSNNVIRSGGW